MTHRRKAKGIAGLLYSVECFLSLTYAVRKAKSRSYDRIAAQGLFGYPNFTKIEGRGFYF